MEAAAMSEQEKAAQCREKGLHIAQLVRWRQLCEQANDWHRSSERDLKEPTKYSRKPIKKHEKELTLAVTKLVDVSRERQIEELCLYSVNY